MSGMSGMPMPGSGTMSMVWMRMPGQSWPGAAASFLGMWIVMMAAMMLPSLVPLLWRYRQAVRGAGSLRLGGLTSLVGLGYFFVWTALGVVVFPLGAVLAAVQTRAAVVAHAPRMAVGLVVLMAGALQLTAWKARRLACFVETPERARTLVADARRAWRHGLRLGVECAHCCVGLMVIPLVVGIMDFRVMAAVTAAITAERLAPAGMRVARAVGVVVVVVGLCLMARAGSS